MPAYDFEKAKEKYRQFCKIEPSLSIYMRDWYLDAVTENENDWKVILIEENGMIVSAFPFGYQKRHGLWYIYSPWQCARMGMWIRNKSYRSKEEELSVLNNYVQFFIDHLPEYDSFKIAFSGHFKNWQPFYWSGFSAEPRYSMVIKTNTDDYIPYIGKSRRNRIRRSQRKYHVQENLLSKQDYWDFLIKSYESKKKKLDYGSDKFFKLWDALKFHNACTVRSILDEDQKLVSVNIMLEDDERCYNQFVTQMQGKDTDATSYAIYEAINYALKKGKIYDFEGSMIKGVCEFNSSFNHEWEVYYLITHCSRKYKVLTNIKEILTYIIRK